MRSASSARRRLLNLLGAQEPSWCSRYRPAHGAQRRASLSFTLTDGAGAPAQHARQQHVPEQHQRREVDRQHAHDGGWPHARERPGLEHTGVVHEAVDAAHPSRQPTDRARVARFTWTKRAPAPSARAVAWPSAGRSLASTTRQPSAASASAVARPMPRPAPVTRRERPCDHRNRARLDTAARGGAS